MQEITSSKKKDLRIMAKCGSLHGSSKGMLTARMRSKLQFQKIIILWAMDQPTCSQAIGE